MQGLNLHLSMSRRSLESSANHLIDFRPLKTCPKLLLVSVSLLSIVFLGKLQLVQTNSSAHLHLSWEVSVFSCTKKNNSPNCPSCPSYIISIISCCTRGGPQWLVTSNHFSDLIDHGLRPVDVQLGKHLFAPVRGQMWAQNAEEFLLHKIGEFGNGCVLDCFCIFCFKHEEELFSLSLNLFV